MDSEGPLPDEQCETIEVPETLSPIDDVSLQEFLDFVDTETQFDDYGFQYFADCKELPHSFM